MQNYSTESTGCVKFWVQRARIQVFEFKVVELEPEGKALAQLKAKDYAAKYRAAGVPIHLVGIEFSKESRRVVGFEAQRLGDLCSPCAK